MAEVGRAKVNREFRDRLTERVHGNVLETGKLAQQLNKSSRSHEILGQTTKHFVNQEGYLTSTAEKVKNMQQLALDMQSQSKDVEKSLQMADKVKTQLDHVWIDIPRG